MFTSALNILQLTASRVRVLPFLCCHPEGRAVCALQDLNFNTVQTPNAIRYLHRASRSKNFLAGSNCSNRFSSARNSGECEIRLHPERRVGCFTCSIS
jgi:hypothetical protein